MTIKSENTFRTSSLVCLWIHKVESDLFCDIDEKLVNMTTVIYIDLLTKNSSICIIVTSPLPSLSCKGLTAKNLTYR